MGIDNYLWAVGQRSSNYTNGTSALTEEGYDIYQYGDVFNNGTIAWLRMSD
jgi:hypothetical protein